MVKDYYGEWMSGRLTPRQFFVWWFLLIAIFIILALSIGASIGIAERIVGGGISEAQVWLRDRFGLPAIVFVVGICFLFILAMLNIIAKRARDIGLPGWITAIVIFGLMGVTSQAGAHNTSGGLGFLLMIVLGFIPTNKFRRH